MKIRFQSAGRVFSPSNFLCKFKRHMFLEARPCLQTSEPVSFLKCDQRCHAEALEKTRESAGQRATLGQVGGCSGLRG